MSLFEKIRTGFVVSSFLIFILFTIQLSFLKLTKPEILDSYILSFLPLAIIAMVVSGFAMIMVFVKWDNPYMNIGNPIAPEYVPTQRIWRVPLIAVIAVAVFWSAASFAGIQALPTDTFIPVTSAGEPMALSAGENIMFSSVYPAFIENYFAFIMVGIVGAPILLLLSILMGGVNSINYIGSRLLAIPIVCYGFTWLIPGFASAHTVVQAGNQQFFITAWIFQMSEQVVILFGGFFIPLAHFLHNMIWSLGLTSAVAFGFIVLGGFLIHKRFIISKNEITRWENV